MICFSFNCIFFLSQILNLFLALLLNSFASDSLKNKKEEVSRITLAIDKLKRWFWMAFNCCICRRRKCKVNSTESLRKNDKEKESSNIKPDIVMVVEDDDKISQIISLHDSGKGEHSKIYELPCIITLHNSVNCKIT